MDGHRTQVCWRGLGVGRRRVVPKAILGRAKLVRPMKAGIVGVDRKTILVEEAVCARHSSAGPAAACTSQSEEGSFVHQTQGSGLGCLKSSLWLLCGPEAQRQDQRLGKPIKRLCGDTERVG